VRRQDGAELLRQAKTILLIDWPSRDVPDTLAKAGFTVITDAGRGRGYIGHEMDGATVVMRKVAELPSRFQIVYAHRPIDELPTIIERAAELKAGAIWLQSGRDATGARDARGCWLPPAESDRARALVESAGMTYVEEPYIADAARSITSR
jgi:predicted CoA-binding protein